MLFCGSCFKKLNRICLQNQAKSLSTVNGVEFLVLNPIHALVNWIEVMQFRSVSEMGIVSFISACPRVLPFFFDL